MPPAVFQSPCSALCVSRARCRCVPIAYENYSTLYHRLQAGLSMIEVLVSLTIVAFGVLGLLGLQARALSFQRDSFDRRTAAEMVTQFAERMRANHLGLPVAGMRPPNASYLHSTTLTPVLITPCAFPTAARSRNWRFAIGRSGLPNTGNAVPVPRRICNGTRMIRPRSRCRSAGRSRRVPAAPIRYVSPSTPGWASRFRLTIAALKPPFSPELCPILLLSRAYRRLAVR